MSQEECWQWLKQLSPKLFGDKVSPALLAIGIRDGIVELLPEGFNKRRLFFMLSRWVSRKEYQSRLILGAPRFSLDGKQSGNVTQDDLDKGAKNKVAYK